MGLFLANVDTVGLFYGFSITVLWYLSHYCMAFIVKLAHTSSACTHAAFMVHNLFSLIILMIFILDIFWFSLICLPVFLSSSPLSLYYNFYFNMTPTLTLSFVLCSVDCITLRGVPDLAIPHLCKSTFKSNLLNLRLQSLPSFWFIFMYLSPVHFC